MMVATKAYPSSGPCITNANVTLRKLECAGPRTHLNETYPSCYWSFSAAVDARLGVLEHSHFGLIMQR